MILTKVLAKKILNSRKEETISVIAESKKISKAIGTEASAPSGKSKGKYEVKDFSSRGIDFSINFINVLGKKLIKEKINFQSFEDLAEIEELVRQYDKTPNLSLVGGNSLYALETAILKLIAASQEQELWQFLIQGKKVILPRPLGNCIGGGAHVKQDKKTDFQEFLLLPKTKHFFDAYFINLQAYKEAKALLTKKDKEWKKNLTDESALATTLDNESTLALLQAVKQTIKEKFDISIELGIDVAASTFWKVNRYRYKNYKNRKKGGKREIEREKILGREEQISYIRELIKKNSLCYVEDPLQQEDFNGFAKLSAKFPSTLITADDLTCTRLELVEKMIKKKAANALIVKPNQISSLLETKKVIDLAKKHGITLIISHRSGETTDNALAHFAVGWQIPIIKTGILGKERIAKLNELVRIERANNVK